MKNSAVARWLRRVVACVCAVVACASFQYTQPPVASGMSINACHSQGYMTCFYKDNTGTIADRRGVTSGTMNCNGDCIANINLGLEPNDWNDVVSTVSNPGALSVTLYEYINYGGATRVVTYSQIVNIVGTDWNDRTSSARIRW
jgi:hypothetical protein